MTYNSPISELQKNIDSLLNSAPENHAIFIDDVRDILLQTVTGKALLNWADAHNTQIIVDEQLPETHAAIYIINSNVIVLNNKFSVPILACFLGHEIRHAWQDDKGFSYNSAYIETGKLLITHRLIEADATAHHIQIAAELCMLNQYDAWGSFETHAEHNGLYKTSLKEYKELALKEENSIKDGRAMLRAFNGWFDVTTMGAYDEMILQKQKAVLLIHLKNHGHDAPIIDTPLQHINYNDKDTLISLGHTLDGKKYFPDKLDDGYDKTGLFDIQNSLDQDFHDLFRECYELYSHIPSPIIQQEKKASVNQPLNFKR